MSRILQYVSKNQSTILRTTEQANVCNSH